MFLTGETQNLRDIFDKETLVEQREKYLKHNLKLDLEYILSIRVIREDLTNFIQQNDEIIPATQ